MTTPEQKPRDLAKRAGIVAVAKVLVEDNGAYGIDEHEFTPLVIEQAKREHPELSDAQAFAKLFTAQTEDGAALRKACAVIKAAAASDPARDDSAEAIAEPQAIGAAGRA